MGKIKEEFNKILSEIEKSKHFKAIENMKKKLNGHPLVLYGCGQICKTIIFICENKGIRVEALCDSNKTGYYEDTKFRIISPKILIEKYPDAFVMITSKRFENEIANTLRQLGFPNKQIYPFPLPHTFILSPKDFLTFHLEGYEWAYDFFKDGTSRRIIIERMRMYLLGTKLRRTSNAAVYFEPGIIKLSQNEIFIDGGGFKGETAKMFIKLIESDSESGYSHVYSFEPDITVFKIADKNLKKYINVDCIAKGLWNSETDLNFFSDGGKGSSSCVSGIPSDAVPVTSIDKFFGEKPDRELPTFIKLDIEGAEKEALIGAENVIKKRHPKLAICVYHKPEDIYEIPKLINEIDSSYKFIMHQYDDGIYDTVLYAI